MFSAFHSDIKAHALLESPKECCGLIVRDNGLEKLIRCENAHSQPNDAFQIPLHCYEDWFRARLLLAYYHSHPHSPETPSEMDKAFSDEAEIPVVIYSNQTDKFFTYAPSNVVRPYENRPFLFGVCDCVSLVLDFYDEELGISLLPFPREPAHVLQGFPSLAEYCHANSLLKVGPPFKRGDIIAMTLSGTGKVNHVAIYLQDKVILHQLFNHLSCRSTYGGHWERSTTAVYRHESNL